MPHKIFISYSWKDKDIVDILDKDWQAVGITLVRDVRDLGYKQDIKEFVAKVHESDYALLLISKHYLESKNCMYEALEMFEQADFKRKILPILTEDARISDPLTQLSYVEYWNARIKRLHTKPMRATVLTNIAVDLEELNLYQKIRDSIEALADQIQSVLCTSWPQTKQGNYSDIFQHIGNQNSDALIECLRILGLDDQERQELALSKLNGNHPNNQFVLFTESTVARLAKKYRKERKILEKLLPEASVLALNRLGILAVEYFREPQIARQYFEQAVKLQPDYVKAHYNLGNLLTTEFQEHQLARKHFEQALALQPDLVNAHFNLATLLMDEFHEHQLAREHFEQAIRLQPDDATTYYNLGNLLITAFQEHQLARALYEQALVLQPDDADVHYNLGTLLTSEFQEYQLAREHFEQAVRLQSTYVDAHINLGTLLMDQFREYQLAREHYEQAVRLRPDDADAHSRLSVLLILHFSETPLS